MTRAVHDTAMRYGRFLLFLALLAATYAVALLLRSRLADTTEARVLAAALTVDLAVVLPLVFHILLVRQRRWPAVSTALFFLLSIGCTALVLPVRHRGGVEVLSKLAVLVELCLIGFVAYKAWNGVYSFRALSREAGKSTRRDLLERLRGAAADVVGVPRVAEVLAYEVAILYYSVASWRRRAPESARERSFTVYRRGNYPMILVGLCVALFAELAIVHLLLMLLWSATAAWVFSVLSVYCFLWLLGDYRAMVMRPLLVTARGLDVRIGLRWSLFVPWDEIAAFQRMSWREPKRRGRGHLNATVLTTPLYEIRLKRPLEARGLYGLCKRVTSVALSVDEREHFETQLRNVSDTWPDSPYQHDGAEMTLYSDGTDLCHRTDDHLV